MYTAAKENFSKEDNMHPVSHVGSHTDSYTKVQDDEQDALLGTLVETPY